MKEFPRKFLSIRDKSGAHGRSKSAPPKSRPRTTDLVSFFKGDSKQKAEQDQEPTDEKIHEIQTNLEQLNITNISESHIRELLLTNVADGDPKLAAEFIDIEQKSAAGQIMPYNPSIHLLGAENRGGVTCYLDALLFAMFCKLDAFECMLKNKFAEDDPKNKLANLLRVWVNLLRSGKLIRTDLTKLIQDTLGDCGWADARFLEQQDTSEAFAFLTETLDLPLLSLQVDLFHQGKRDDDDHKVVYERLLNLAVPPDPEGKGIRLEDCLEEYFNARVDVSRDHEEAKKSMAEDVPADDIPALVRKNTIKLLREEGAVLSSSPVDLAPLHPFPTRSSIASTSTFDPQLNSQESEQQSSQSPTEGAGDSSVTSPSKRSTNRTRSGSVIQRVMLDETGKPTNEDANTAPRSRRKGSMVVKAVTIPAWQFFRLIPWHAVSSAEPTSDSEVALNFEQRPVVGICLKRYLMTENGEPQRHNTFIDIPDSLRLPHFMLAEGRKEEEDSGGLNTEYKLVLQSVICHRGDSLQSGHYITFARMAPKPLVDNRRHDFDPPPDYEEAQWVKFDDLDEPRISYVDDIRQCLKDEMPYLVFYQVVPMVELACPSIDGTATGPPSYQESKISLELQTSRAPTEGSQSIRSKPPSIRLSFENDTPRPLWDHATRGPLGNSTPSGSRRTSLMDVVESAIHTPSITPARTPEGQSPVIGPADDSTASRLSRAASRFALGRTSRPTSQSGEGRKSLTMSRLGGLRKPSRDVTADTVPGDASVPPSTADSSVHTAENSIEGEKSQTSHGKHGNKAPKSKDKAKEKVLKQKQQGAQPERECVVM